MPADPNTGRYYDTYLQTLLAPGNYRAAVSVYSNFGPDNLNTDTFDNEGDFSGRSANFAFDVLGVDAATGPGGVPEPATWAMMLIGFGAVGYGLRRRQGAISTRVTFA